MKYGTAGFRDNANKIINISFKIGQIICYLANLKNENFGIMITASHNEYLDNGLKIVDKNGNMIKKEYEILLEKYINNQFIIPKIINKSKNKIFLGYDTRNSYQEIKQNIINGISSNLNNLQIIDLGFVTTPQHHFLVKYNFEL